MSDLCNFKFIFLSVLSVRRMESSTTSKFPSISALASPNWPRFDGKIYLAMASDGDIWADENEDVTDAVFVAYKNLDLISTLEERNSNNEHGHRYENKAIHIHHVRN
jgi:hypothetical protein